MIEANPQLALERREPVELSPVLILHGAADRQITPGMAEAFVKAYSEAGGVIELAKYPDAPHGFIREDDENGQRALSAARSFIARQVSTKLLPT